MNIPEIIENKTYLNHLKSNSWIESSELPYENLLKRLSTAIVFVDPKARKNDDMEMLWDHLNSHTNLHYQIISESHLSTLSYRITFNEEHIKSDIPVDFKISH